MLWGSCWWTLLMDSWWTLLMDSWRILLMALSVTDDLVTPASHSYTVISHRPIIIDIIVPSSCTSILYFYLSHTHICDQYIGPITAITLIPYPWQARLLMDPADDGLNTMRMMPDRLGLDRLRQATTINKPTVFMHVALMISWHEAQNTFRGAWKTWHESQRLCMRDVTTALTPEYCCLSILQQRSLSQRCSNELCQTTLIMALTYHWLIYQ